MAKTLALRTRPLGSSGLEITTLGFGSWAAGGGGWAFGWGPQDDTASLAAMRHALEVGVNWIDTAAVYGLGHSEAVVGRLLRDISPSDRPLVFTKCGLVWDDQNRMTQPRRILKPESIRTECEASLRRLGIERIDLYQLHRIDPKVPVEESLGALKDFQKAGKIRHIGLSEVSTAELDQAGKTVKIVSVQNQYNLSDRRHEEVLKYSEEHNLAFIPWFPVAAGKLARPGGPLDQIAKKHKASVAQVSLAWLLHHSPVMLPIPGTSSVEHLEENMEAGKLHLSAAEWKTIEGAAGKNKG